eukprot:scaffold2251_cov178-Amphora_coffeaeformis.AAC.3
MSLSRFEHRVIHSSSSPSFSPSQLPSSGEKVTMPFLLEWDRHLLQGGGTRREEMYAWVSGAVVLLTAYLLRKPFAALARQCLRQTSQKEEENQKPASTTRFAKEEKEPLLKPPSTTTSTTTRAKDVIAMFEQQALANGVVKKHPSIKTRSIPSASSDIIEQEPNHAKTSPTYYWRDVLWSLFHTAASPREEVSPELHQVASDKNHPVPPEDKHQVEKVSVNRCPACRKKLEDGDVLITCQNWSVHVRCFICRECGDDLSRKPSLEEEEEEEEEKDVHMSKSNGKIKFTCATCHDVSMKLSDSFASIAGERIVIDESEYGNVDKVVGEIGDDLEQAVYFMTPRCATCGGDLNQTYKKEGVKVIGRTVYHPYCFDNGRPAPELAEPSVKLPPSFCAKYLPPQIILKLSTAKETLTTLYFCWKNRVEQANKLREEDSSVVVVTFVLDEEAPANPNHQSSNSKRKQPKAYIVQPDLSTAKVELVSGVQVGPRNPIMPKPAWIESQSFRTQLTYLHFGLEYCLELIIPSESDALLNLSTATLSIKIQDWQ